MRLPRVLLAGLVGAGLSVSGCAFQSLFGNPLATPDTLGVASGASFGAALALLLGLTGAAVQGMSMLFGLAAVAITALTGWGREARLGMILGGILVGSLFTSLVSLVKFAADTESQLPAITYWLMGSFSAAGYDTLARGAPPILAGVVILWLLRWRLNLLPLSPDEARTSGVHIGRLRIVTVLCATGVTAAAVALCGQVGWVGLLIPHLCRLRVGGNHLALIPASSLIGAAFMIIVDTAARALTPAEIPVSILTALIGAPFFIILMRKNPGRLL
jgi:iron complex transport system permease protein